MAASADINTDIFIALPGHDPDDDAHSFIASSLPGSGQLWDGSKINNGSLPHTLAGNIVEFRPTGGTSGVITFTYEIDAGGDTSNSGTVTITLGHTPDADDLSVAINEDITLDVLLSGSHSTDEALSFIVTSLPGNGTLKDVGSPVNSVPSTLSSNTASYTTNHNYFGPDSFDYIVSLVINLVNDAPVPQDDSPSVDEGNSTNVDVLDNDSDDDGDALTISVFSAPSNGTAVVNNNGTPGSPADDTIDYTHNGSETTSDSFVYQVDDGNSPPVTATVNINAINDVPVAINDNNASLGASPDEDSTLNVAAIGVLTNDTDAESGALTVIEVQSDVANVGQPVLTSQGATVTLNANGSFVYDPSGLANVQALPVGGNLDDTFTYLVEDNENAPSAGPATVTLNITGINDVPVAVDDNNITLAISPTLTEDRNIILPAPALLGNDIDVDSGDTFFVSSVQGNSAGVGGVIITDQGAWAIVYLTGELRYFPTFSVTLRALGSGDSVVDTFTYRIKDSNSGESVVATVSLAVEGVNDAPIAIGESERIVLGCSVNTDVLANDVNYDGSLFTVTITSGPSFGSVTVKPNGTVDYTHNGSTTATDSYSYVANDGFDDSNVVSVTIEVLGVNTIYDLNDGVCNGTHCSLREAIHLANADPSFDAIAFRIPANQANANGDYLIKINSALPIITASGLLIDGSTQPGFAARGGPVVVLAGKTNVNYNGLHIAGSGNTIRGLVIELFGLAGILVTGPGSNVIEGNYLGTDPTGSIAEKNSNGIYIFNSPDNLVGGTATGAGNLISGNVNYGVRIEGACDKGCNTIAFNGADGIIVRGDNNEISDNSILGNSIFANVGIGINLDSSFATGRRTPNDFASGSLKADWDAGPNNLQNSPGQLWLAWMPTTIWRYVTTCHPTLQIPFTLYAWSSSKRVLMGSR